MSSIAKPLVTHPGARTNALGLKLRDYEGSMSTLCAGCGHDSVTAALIQAAWELAIPPEMAAKMSGIGCSAKTTAYFMKQSHGFNSVHGRMPSVTTGAAAANRSLVCIGVSGDGDSLLAAKPASSIPSPLKSPTPHCSHAMQKKLFHLTPAAKL